MSGKRLLPLALAVAVGLTVSACSSSSASTTPSSGASSSGAASAAASTQASPVSVSETGSSLLYPLFNLWDPAYQQQHSNVTITAQSTGSGTGIAQATAGAADIGASDAYLSSQQVAASPGMENVALAISAQQVNYNLPGLANQHLKLDGTTLAKMYLGKITKWNDPAIAALNPGVTLPSTTIVPLHRSDGSGDTFLFTQYLTDQDKADWGSIGFGTTVAFPSVAGALGEQGNGGMVSGCQATPGCVAYVGISFLDKATQAGLGYASLKNGAGSFELPTATTIAAEAAGLTSTTPANEAVSLINGNVAGGYPIINYEYAILNTSKLSGATGQAVKDFLSWAISSSGGNTASYLDQVHFQPLPSSVAQLSQTLIDKIGS